MHRHFLITIWALLHTLAVCTLLGQTARAEDGPEVPRIDSVVMSAEQRPNVVKQLESGCNQIREAGRSRHTSAARSKPSTHARTQ